MQFEPTNHKRGVGVHPHRGFETVTLVYDGEVAHKDSTGEQGLIGPGDVQWMTAGSGILHEEFNSDSFSRGGGILNMVQLWVNLPKRDKMTAPSYQTITAKQIPSIDLADQKGTLRLISGNVGELVGPARTHTPVLVMDGSIKAASQYQQSVAEGWSTIVIVRKGQVLVNKCSISAGQTIILSHGGQGLELVAEQDSDILILGGEPIDEPLIGYGPFVMNSEAEIEQAITDFQSGKFGQLEH